MSKPLTIEQKREALEAAGKRVRSNASAETIELAYLELEAEQEAAWLEVKSPEPELSAEGLEDIAAACEPDPEPETSEVPSAPSGPVSLLDIINQVRAEARSVNRDFGGDRDPKVLEWARANMSREAFEAHYGNRANFTA